MTDTGWTQTYSWMLSREIDGYELTVSDPVVVTRRNRAKYWSVWTDLDMIAAGSSRSTRTAKAAAMRAMRKHRREQESKQ